MKTLTTLLIIFLLTPFTNISAVPAVGPSRLPSQTKAVKAAARKAWPTFFASFRTAVKRRDRAALEKMMDANFNGPPHTKGEAFRRWDDPKMMGWKKLDQALSKGAVLTDESENDSPPESIQPTMISPPAAERGRYSGWFAAFVYQEDGEWRCIQFTSHKDFPG